MQPSKPTRPRADLARPLAFTLLMLYGLLSFLTGYRDLRLRQLSAAMPYVLILGGVLLGSAAIRALMRRRRAFGQALVVLLGLLILDLFTELAPSGPSGWRAWLARAVLSAVILWLTWRTDAALPAPAGEE